MKSRRPASLPPSPSSDRASKPSATPAVETPSVGAELTPAAAMQAQGVAGLGNGFVREQLGDRVGARGAQGGGGLGPEGVDLMAWLFGPDDPEHTGLPPEERPAVVQRKPAEGGQVLPAETDPKRVAARGVSSGGSALPFAQRIQESFGHHDLTGVRAHMGGAAGAACSDLGASAFATGSDIAFARAPDLYTAAHEAAHVIQQRKGVSLKGGVGQDGDVYERHADAVADAVVRGESAETLLDDATKTAASGSNAPASPTAVQRSADPNQNQEWIPQVSVDPETIAAVLGETATFDHTVDNVSEAPAGTTTSIDGGTANPSILELDGLSTRMSLSGRAVGVGETTVNAHLKYQVPGGPEMVRRDVVAPYLAVFPPTGSWEVKVQRVDGSEDTDTRRLKEGDLLRLQMEVGDHRDISGIRKTFFSVGLLGHFAEEMRLVEGQSVLWTLKAVQLGPFDMDLGVEFGENLTGTHRLATQVAGVVEMSLDDFGASQGRAHRYTHQQFNQLALGVEKLCWAYHDAWKEHVNALTDQAEVERLAGDLILTAALTVLTGGLGGLVGAYMKNTLKAGNFFSDAVKDLAKMGSKTVGSAVWAAPGPGTFQAFPNDPFEWELLAKSRVLEEGQRILDLIVEWDERSIAPDETDFHLDFDPETAIREQLRIQNQALSDVGAAFIKTSKQIRDDFETGFWIHWLENYAYTVETSSFFVPDPFSPPSFSARENVGENIRKRLDVLSLHREAFDAAMELSRQRAQSRADEINEGTGHRGPNRYGSTIPKHEL